MGTRADFYLGNGRDAIWIGSVGWDGYEWEEDPSCPLMTAKTKEEFLAAIDVIAKERDDWTPASLGWPWPWDDSKTTDRAYAFTENKTSVYEWGRGSEWPNMKDKKAVTLGYRSGLTIV